MKFLILVIAATLCTAQNTGLASGILSGVSCAAGSLTGCYDAADEAISYFAQYVRRQVSQSCFENAANSASCATPYSGSVFSFEGFEAALDCTADFVGTYVQCIAPTSNSKLTGIDSDLVAVLKKVGKDIKNVAPKFTQNLAINTFQMGVKQYLYRGIDFTHHVHAMVGAFLKGNKLYGDNYFAYGAALGNFIGFLSSTESLIASAQASE